MSNLETAIRERKSVRTFNADRPLSDEEVEVLRNAVNEATSPFGGKLEVELHKFDLEGSFKPSTYGTISGAQWFFLMGTDSSIESQLSLGFKMEQVVLKATEMGLGTCWIAATFKGTSFAHAANFSPTLPLQIIMPVGYPANKRRMIESITRMAVGSAKRKPLSDLFIGAEGSKFEQPLEMMRLAPSSTNSQPWRGEVVGDTVYFYYENKSEASVLDLGIGLSHFYLTCQALGIPGTLTICKEAPAHDKWIPLVKFQ